MAPRDVEELERGVGWRPRVALPGLNGSRTDVEHPGERDLRDAKVAEPPKPRRPDSKTRWAELLQRVFREDVLACPCGGRRRVIAFITKQAVVKAILEHLGLPTTGPTIAPARSTAPPEAAPWQDDVPSLQLALR